MKRLAVMAVAVLLMLLPTAACAEAAQEEQLREEIGQGIGAVLEDLDLAALEELYGETALSEKADFSDLLKDIAENGFSAVSVEEILQTVFEELKRELSVNLTRIGEIVVILVITGILRQLPSGGKGAARIASWTGCILSCGIAAAVLVDCFGDVRAAMSVLYRVIETITPLLMVLLTGMGGLSGSSVMSPVMAALTGVVFRIVEEWIFPLVIAGGILGMCASISSAVRLDKLSELSGSIVKWGLGILFTVFVGICAMKGIAGAAVDGVYFKTAKFTIDRTVPVIGGMFSDTLDTIMACSMLVKNSVGFIGLIVLAAMLLSPIMSLLTAMLAFRAGAAVVQPFADAQAVGMLERMGRTAELAFLVVLTCAAMAFISIALLMGAADMSFMMR